MPSRGYVALETGGVLERVNGSPGPFTSLLGKF